MDLCGGISPGSVRNRKVHGLWVYDGDDAQYHTSGEGSVVCGSKINYYYGGQYFAVFLTKLTNTQVHRRTI